MPKEGHPASKNSALYPQKLCFRTNKTEYQ